MPTSPTASILLNPGARGSILGVDHHPDRDQLIGSHIGAVELVKALLRESPAGSVACIASPEQAGLAQYELRRLAENEGGAYASAPVVEYTQAGAFMAQHPVGPLFEMGGPWLHRVSYLRDRFAPKPVPVQCLVHGFSYSEALLTLFVNLLVTPTLPCDSVVCTTEAAWTAFMNRLDRVRDELAQSGVKIEREPPRVDVIPLGVDTERFRPRDREQARQLLGLPPDKSLLLHFGRIDIAAKSDPGPLLLAFRELMQRHGPRIGLVLAGNAAGRTGEHVQRLVAMLGRGGQVYVRPQPTAAEAPLYYAAADLFVSLSDTVQESFGLTPLEAMASGLAVVVSDWSGYRETVVHGETGFRVPTLWAECDEEVNLFGPLRSWEEDHLRLGQSVAVDYRELVEWLDMLVSNPALCERLGGNARRHVEASYAWPHVVARYRALWDELWTIAAALPAEMPRAHYMQAHYYADYAHYAT